MYLNRTDRWFRSSIRIDKIRRLPAFDASLDQGQPRRGEEKALRDKVFCVKGEFPSKFLVL